MRRLLPLRLLPLLAPLPLLAQAPTATPVNLWSVPLRMERGRLVAGEPVKLTGDRGTNSQPSFTPDGGAIVFSAVRDTGRDARSDIYRIDLRTGAETRVTRTPENENSPTVTADGGYVAVRWVPATLFREYGPWAYDSSGTPVRAILPGPDTTGYYVALPDGRWALTRPKHRAFTIGLFDPKTGAIVDVDSGVPALPARLIPGERALSWVVIDSVRGRHMLRRYDLADGRVTTLLGTVPGRTAHAWMPTGGMVLMAKGDVLYAKRPLRERAWTPVARFTDPGLRQATAYVVSPQGDRLIVVAPLRPSLAVAMRDSLEAGRTAHDVAALIRGRAMGPLASYDLAEGALVALAQERVQRGAPADGVMLLQAVADASPQSWRAMSALGDAQLAAGDRTAAQASWRRALALDPRTTDDERVAAAALEKKLAGA